jgi:soluble epoxide hydrolase/lipid-phosphate phosphatase
MISLLSIKHADRFLGFGWLAVLRHVPRPFPPIDLILELQTKAYGRPLMGYWKFFEQESCPSISEKNVSVRATLLTSLDNRAAKLESFISALYPDNPDDWLTLMNKPGEIQAFIESGKTTKRASYLTEEVCVLLLSQTCSS